MSAQASVSQLPGAIKDLVLSVAKEGQDFGSSEKDKAEVSGWIEKIAKANYAFSSSLLTRTGVEERGSFDSMPEYTYTGPYDDIRSLIGHRP